MGTTKEIEQLKKDFREWSGFEMKSKDYDGMIEEIKEVQSTLENEVFLVAKTFRKRLYKIFPNDCL